jgi:hypothetical protein
LIIIQLKETVYNGLQNIYKLVEMLGMLERGTNLFNLIEASENISKFNSFQE